MIVSTVPLRVSLLGGGSDMEEYFAGGTKAGACLSVTINRGIHAIIQDASEFSVEPEADSKLTRKVLDYFCKKVGTPDLPLINLSFREDIPTRGTGLGSSSAWVQALLRALEEYQKRRGETPFSLKDQDVAELSYNLERTSGASCGKQDHYAAANPHGVKLFSFFDKRTTVQYIKADPEILKSLTLFNIGGKRDSNAILAEQGNTIKGDRSTMDTMATLARVGAAQVAAGDLDGLADSLNEAWRIKRLLANGITDERIDAIYHDALKAGALGGKILGAGGAGYMMFLCRNQFHAANVQGTIESHGVTRVHFSVWEDVWRNSVPVYSPL